MNFIEQIKKYLSNTLVGEKTHAFNEINGFENKICYNVDNKYIVWVYPIIDSSVIEFPDKITIDSFYNLLKKKYPNYTIMLLTANTNKSFTEISNIHLEEGSENMKNIFLTLNQNRIDEKNIHKSTKI